MRAARVAVALTIIVLLGTGSAYSAWTATELARLALSGSGAYAGLTIACAIGALATFASAWHDHAEDSR